MKIRYAISLTIVFFVLGLPRTQAQVVNITAVDAPALHMQGNKVGIGEEMRAGHGVVIDPSGVIATDQHIIGHARHIYVGINGRTFEALVVRVGQSDLCLIKIAASFLLRTMALADPSQIRTGSKVISADKKGRIIQVFKGKTSQGAELLKVDIPSKQGDSGGPVLNKKGSVVGLIMGRRLSDPSESYVIAASRIRQEYLKWRGRRDLNSRSSA